MAYSSGSDYKPSSSRTKLFGQRRPLHALLGGGRCLFFHLYIPLLLLHELVLLPLLKVVRSFPMASRRRCALEEQAAIGCDPRRSDRGLATLRGCGVQPPLSALPPLHQRHARRIHLVQRRCPRRPVLSIPSPLFLSIRFVGLRLPVFFAGNRRRFPGRSCRGTSSKRQPKSSTPSSAGSSPSFTASRVGKT